MKRFLLAFAATLVLCVPAFAADPYFVADTIDLYNPSHTYSISESDSARPIFHFQQYNYDNTKVNLYTLSLSQNAPYTALRLSDNATLSQNCSDSFVTVDSTPIWRNHIIFSFNVSDGYSLPHLSIYPNTTTPAMIGADFLDFLTNPPVEPGVQSTFTVPCGNVLYFKVDVEQDVRLSAVMPILSSLIGTSSGAWNSGIEFGPAAALPSSGTTFPILSQDPVNFAKSASNQNLLGQTKSASSVKHCIAGQYYALYLPYHYGGWLALGSSHVYPDGSTSGGIIGANVTVSGSFTEIKIYPLSEKANGDLLTGSVTLDSGSDDGFASYFDGEISENGTVTWLDQDGEISTPTVGGTSYVPEDVSTESIIDQIKNILSSIVSEIKNLFSFGYEAVNTLVSLMHDFVGVFKQLYEWLPAEVYSALVSAIIVAITIGVFKVFL